MIYPEDVSVDKWSKDDLTFSIVKHGSFGHYCGYVRYPRRPVIESGYDGILTYAPVHGGITYADESNDGTMVYGFDCNHVGDECRPECKDINWLKQECERMAACINIAAQHEHDYLLAKNEASKAAAIDGYHREVAEKIGAVFKLTENFGAMINVLGGESRYMDLKTVNKTLNDFAPEDIRAAERSKMSREALQEGNRLVREMDVALQKRKHAAAEQAGGE